MDNLRRNKTNMVNAATQPVSQPLGKKTTLENNHLFIFCYPEIYTRVPARKQQPWKHPGLHKRNNTQDKVDSPSLSLERAGKSPVAILTDQAPDTRHLPLCAYISYACIWSHINQTTLLTTTNRKKCGVVYKSAYTNTRQD